VRRAPDHLANTLAGFFVERGAFNVAPHQIVELVA
jgi:hypothetical protein